MYRIYLAQVKKLIKSQAIALIQVAVAFPVVGTVVTLGLRKR